MLRKSSVLSFLSSSHSINSLPLTQKDRRPPCRTLVRHMSFYKDPNKEGKVCPLAPRDKVVQNDIYGISRPNVVVKSTPICNVKPTLDCNAPNLAVTCTERMSPPKFVPPPPPKTKFPWIYLLPVAFLFGSCGIVYQLYERRVKQLLIMSEKKNWKPRKFKKTPSKPFELPKEAQYLIIGAGAAGMAAYNAIKEHDENARVLMLTEEDINPYVRTGLNKELWTVPKPPDVESLSFMNGDQETSLFYMSPDEYIDPKEFATLEEGPAVSVVTGWTVVRVDADERIVYVTSKDGDLPIKYEKCLIATGSDPKDLHIFKIAPHEVQERVCRLRRIRDLEVAWHRVRNATKILVVGDGPLACELAYSLKHLDEFVKREPEEEAMEVTQIMKPRGILSRVLPDYLGQWGAEQVKAEGVKLMTNLQVYDSYFTDEDELKVFLSNGEEITTDFIFLAIGVEPRTELAERSSLELDKKLGGYIVNPELLARTDLYVAGDCASLYEMKSGSRTRMEHYGAAVNMGCIAGENMTGNMKPFTEPCIFSVKLGKNVVMQAFGETKSSMATVGVFTTCTIEQNMKTSQNTLPEDVANKGEIPCYKKTDEYKKKFKKGVIFYLRDTENVGGIVLWNMEGKEEQVLEILANNPTYDNINSFVTKLELHEEDCCKQSVET